MNSSLYIIGNGFDIYNNLNTRYSDFHKFVIRNFPDLENRFEEYFFFETDSAYLWKNFEYDLSTFNYKSLFDEFNHLDISSDSFKPSEAYGLEDDIRQAVDELVVEIRDAFTQWINEIEFPAKNTNTFRFAENSLFIVFNYTDTLENLYQVPKSRILYLHNKANDGYGDLIFGHAESEESTPVLEDFDEYGEPNRTLFTDSENASRYPFYAFMKKTEDVLSEHATYFDSLPLISEVIILGHSLGKPDWPYFILLNKLLPHSIWKISFYTDKEHDLLYSIATNELGIAIEKIKMIKIEDEIQVY